MSFFKDFKEDLSQAVNELMPGEEEMNDVMDKEAKAKEPTEAKNALEELDGLDKLDGLLADAVGGTKTEVKPNLFQAEEEKRDNKGREKTMNTGSNFNMQRDGQGATEETAIITNGMVLTGNLETTGSIEVRGLINGDVRSSGKMIVTGTINGNSQSAEFFADEAKIEGEIVAEGTVKIGAGSVIVGNITATSAVIAGAIKGDIDVQGPVIVDTSAVVMGNIKSKSVQINNGAVIEGFCSQCYSEIDVQSIFGK